MATNAVDMKVVGAPFGNAREIVRVVYDFAADGGAVSQINLLKAQGSIVVKLAYALVKTACTSDGSATAKLGKATGAELLAATAVASLTLDAIFDTGTPAAVELTNGEYVAINIGTAALTAGKIEAVFEVFAK